MWFFGKASRTGITEFHKSIWVCEKIAVRKSVPQLHEEKFIVSFLLHLRFLKFITMAYYSIQRLQRKQCLFRSGLLHCGSDFIHTFTFDIWMMVEHSMAEKHSMTQRVRGKRGYNCVKRVGRTNIAVPEGFLSFIPRTMISKNNVEFATVIGVHRRSSVAEHWVCQW